MYVAVLHKAGANAKGILQYLRERTGKKTTLRDVHNMVMGVKSKQKAVLTDAQRAFAVLDEFCGQNGGNSADVLVDCETNVARVVTFQTAKMKRLFKAFPEVVLVDSTHNTNANRYKLFSFVVHDVFGKGQYVHHALVESEHKINLGRVIEIFKKNNPEWSEIRVIMTDKAVHEKQVLHEMFPQARQRLCQWQVITWLKKQVARLGESVKREVKGLMSLLVYAKSEAEYADAKGAMLRKLGGLVSHPLYKTFVENWDNNKKEWVSFLRGNVPHLTNNTSNRIESKWGEIKDVIKDTLTIDQLVSTLIALQEYAEEQYIADYHRVGSRPSVPREDPELASLALQISKFDFDLVCEQHVLATGPNTDYDVELGSPGKATVKNSRSGNAYEVNTMTSQCNCTFMNTCLLPCRHVMYVRSTCNYETVIPSMRFSPARWVAHSPVNNIAEGDVRPGGLNQITCPALPNEKSVSSGAMYIETKALAEKVIARMALQSTPTYRVVFQWLKEFYEALNAGTVSDFTERKPVLFPGLSQVSSVGAARLSQMSFTDMASDTPDIVRSQVQIKFERDADARDTIEVCDFGSVNAGEPDGVTSGTTEPEEIAEVGDDVDLSVGGALPKMTKSAPNLTESGGAKNSKTGDTPRKFAPPPKLGGMSKEERKKAKTRKERLEARALAAQYREGNVTAVVKFDDVAALLNGAYSMFHTKAMVDALEIPYTEVHSSVSVRPFNVGQDVPVIKKIPQLDKLSEAIEAIKLKGDIDRLAYWPNYGYASFDQLDAMVSILEARNNFKLVTRTLKWIDDLEWRVSDLRAPFNDTSSITKSEYKGYVETLNLSVNKVPGETVAGYHYWIFGRICGFILRWCWFHS